MMTFNPALGRDRDSGVRLVRVVLTAVLAALLLAIFSARAEAVSCWGDWCSGTNPEATGCSAGAYTVASQGVYGTSSTLELRWSPTCKTNWARISAAYGTHYPSKLHTVQCATGYRQSGVVQSNASYSWTRQIYSPVKKVRAEFDLFNLATWCV